MAGIFSTKDTVFFVGGRGTKTGDADAGGCTQTFWDASLTLSDVMNTNGGVMSEDAGCDISNDDSKVRITGEGTAFANSAEGLIAYVTFSAVYDNGYYEVHDVEASGDYIVIDLAYQAPGNGEPTCSIWVGGAFDTLQNAVDKTDATGGYNVRIYDNKPETLAAAVDFDTTGGSIANNSQMIVEGFLLLPGDMSYGGTYYQGPIDALINGVDTGKCVTLNADGGAYDVITINDFDGLVLKNLYFYNTDKADDDSCIAAVTNPANISIINCKFDTAYRFISGNMYGLIMDGCYIGADLGYIYGSAGLVYPGLFTNSVFNGTGRTTCGYFNYPIFEHCLFWGGAGALRIITGLNIINCIFYGQTIECLLLGFATAAHIAGHNNVFMPAAAADFVAYAATGLGSISDDALKRSCIWTIAGAAVTNHISVNSITRQLSDVIELDPQFVDAANSDFRLLPTSPLLNTGQRTIGGETEDGYTTIGAWGRISYLLGMK